MMENIFKKMPVSLMEKVLNVTSIRQRIVASNIANVQTPGYKQKEVDFAASLSRAVEENALQAKIEHPRHMSFETKNETTNAVVDERLLNSDIEEEMALSAENQLLYAAAVKILNGNFQALRASIRGRF